jgi:hypothetical protein
VKASQHGFIEIPKVLGGRLAPPRYSLINFIQREPSICELREVFSNYYR